MPLTGSEVDDDEGVNVSVAVEHVNRGVNVFVERVNLNFSATRVRPIKMRYQADRTGQQA